MLTKLSASLKILKDNIEKKWKQLKDKKKTYSLGG
jgi:hypothetical protein